MKSIAKLKDQARKHEQKEDWKSAIEAYRQVLGAQEADGGVDLELGLYNRVGDLYLRLGQTDDAVSYYEKAADRYADSGFFNNAIALCNKALRHRPDRASIYLKLSRFCLEQGFMTDARRWIIDYAEREVKRGNVDAARQGLEEFAQAADAPDVRELVAQHLARHDRKAEAINQLRIAHEEWTGQGDQAAADRVAAAATALDPAVKLGAATPEPEPEPAPEPSHPDDDEGLQDLETGIGDDLGLETTAYEAGASDEGDFMADGGLEGLETHRAESSGDQGSDSLLEEEPALDVDGWGDEPVPEEEEAEPLPMLDFDDEIEDDASAEEETEPLPLLDQDEALDHPFEEEPDIGEPAAPESEATEPLGDEWSMDEPVADDEPYPEPAADEPAPEEPGVEEPGVEEPVREEPAIEEPLAASGGLDLSFEGTGGGPILPGQMDAGSSGGDPDDATVDFEPLDVDLSTLGFGGAPASTPEAQETPDNLDVNAVLDRAKELVSRGLLREAARELRLLSGAEASTDEFRQALSVTNEIVRHDPDNVAVFQRRVEFANRTGDRNLIVGSYADLAGALAREGSETKARAMYRRVLDLDPDNAVALEALGGRPEPQGDDVDLDAILKEMQHEGGAGNTDQSGGDTDENFASMLSQFKSRSSDAGAREDAGDHYDLGLAFKEMGLIDEAIGEFQAALAGGEQRLKAYEELGQCFILKGQFTLALKILQHALKAPREQESDLLGVYYHIGKCYEELGDRAEARAAYEKILDINPHFADVPARVGRL